MTNIYPSKGEIWYVMLDQTIGHEQARTRPCLVISSNDFNHGSSKLTMVLPITTRNRYNPLHVPIQPPEGGLVEPSVILCDQLRTISHKRLLRNGIGKISAQTLQHVTSILQELIIED